MRLTTRFLLTTTLGLAASLGLGAWVVDRAFAAGVVASAEEQLELVVYTLLGAAEEGADGLQFPDDLSEPRLSQPESGLYALVRDARGDVIWASRSYRLSELSATPARRVAEPGVFEFDAGERYFTMQYAVIWEAAQEARYEFLVLADRTPFQARIAGFRRNLTLGAGGVIVLLAAVQYFAVLWGLRPIRLMAQRVHELEAGRRSHLGRDYPIELMGLARNLDRFIDHEAGTRERYRRAMADLAHSLKTPLAVLRNALAERGDADRVLMAEQVERMDATVGYQLSRARAAPPAVLPGAVPVAPLVERLLQALERAYADKRVHASAAIDADVAVRADERDVMEMLGNVLDNAFKYCRSAVRVAADAGEHVTLTVADDGDGVAAALRRQVLARGARADTARAGHGIGLAVTVDLAASYGGQLTIGESTLGGALVTLVLPA